jgi:hypothetical protein
MTSRGKKIFIVLTIVIPFLIYSVVYYQEKFRYANFKAKDFVSFEYKWGVGKNLENSYNSATGIYIYHDAKDSVVKKNLKLSQADFKYLDSIGDVQGFWNLPPVLANSEEDLMNPKILRYDMKFNYKHGEQAVIYLFNYNITERKRSAAAQMQKEIEQLLIEAEKRAN